MKHTLKRTTWIVLPAALAEAGTLAFPNCKSPRSVPDAKWNELLVAYVTWHHIFYSDELCYKLIDCTVEKQQKYLNDIALKIAED